LPAGVEVDIGFAADDGHCLGAGAAHGYEIGREGLRARNGFGRRAGAADQHAQGGGFGLQGWREFGAETLAECRQGDRAVRGDPIDAQAHMDRPIVAALAIFAGAVQRVDDPDAA
jgi:hypothetical protein